ncbi:MAG: AAA family ATPase [Lewinellaceae bacterium]|nr:AAA family ATPase [Lewinellaceae bacterium]
MKTIAFFNNKGGVGKTSLVYHLSWMFSNMGKRVIAADLDPQANLTSMFLDNQELLTLWESDSSQSIYDALVPLIEGVGDIENPSIHSIDHSNKLGLLAGDLFLSRFEDQLSENWPKCLSGDPRAFRVISAFYRLLYRGAQGMNADLVLIDVGPNLGAINRAALISADYVVVPLGADLFSLQGLQNLGPSLITWRKEWKKRLVELPESLQNEPMPNGRMQPIGYVLLQHGARENRPVKAYDNWAIKIPSTYIQYVLNNPSIERDHLLIESDPNNLGMLKHYRSLMPLAMAARKPMFYLKPADGAIGAHVEAVRSCFDDFKQLADKILHQIE